jgi:hypothetical protein
LIAQPQRFFLVHCKTRTINKRSLATIVRSGVTNQGRRIGENALGRCESNKTAFALGPMRLVRLTAAPAFASKAPPEDACMFASFLSVQGRRRSRRAPSTSGQP